MKPAGSPPQSERFLSRWSRLKRAQARRDSDDGKAPLDDTVDEHGQHVAPQDSVQPELTHPGGGENRGAAAAPLAGAHAPEMRALPPDLPPIASLTMESDYSPFFREDVPEELRRAAVKKLFADPHFNVMDGLDTYIDDYSKPDPIPPAMLAALNHARGFLASAEETASVAPPDEGAAASSTQATAPPRQHASAAADVSARAGAPAPAAPGMEDAPLDVTAPGGRPHDATSAGTALEGTRASPEHAAGERSDQSTRPDANLASGDRSQEPVAPSSSPPGP